MRIEINEQFYESDDEFSTKDFTGRSLLDQDLNGKVIARSCFSQETPDAHIFPDNMTGATFINCNLDNVFIPEGNTVIECSTRRFEVQNDLNDWEIDAEGNPTRPLGYEALEKEGLEVPDASSIPSEEVDEFIDLRQVALEQKELKTNLILEK